VNKSEREMLAYLKAVDRVAQGRSVESLVLRNGQFYRPQPLPAEYKRGKIKECFYNAYKLSWNKNLTYVEGFANGALVPVQHAWCVDAAGNVIDNTWPDCGTVYYGVALDKQFVDRVVLETGTYGVLDFRSAAFRKHFFTRKGELK
jgi:hypothetical protein